jgi:hypothetical protein
MKKWILWLILIFSFLFEGTITTLPLVLIAFLILMIFLRAKFLFWLALICGILLDIFQLRVFGLTSLLLVVFLFIVFLYEKKFESSTGYFILLATFIGSIIYLSLLNINYVFFQSLLASILAFVVFKILIISEVKKPKYKLEK